MAGKQKTGGRTKGTPNKITHDVRDTFRQLLNCNSPKMQSWIDMVAKKNPEKAFRLMIELAAFIVPKPKQSEDLNNVDPITGITIIRVAPELPEIKVTVTDEVKKVLEA